MPEKVRNRLTSKQIGFLAQNVEQVYPNLVITNDSTGLKSVDYIGFIPIIVQALKEQDSLINLQSSQIKALQKLVNKGSNLKSATVSSQSTQTDITTLVGGEATLDQNAPNPFNRSTNIGYYLPENVQNAILYIYDMNGVQIKSIPVTSKGKGSITINGYELRPGMYLYILLYDGKATDSKRMILTQ